MTDLVWDESQASGTDLNRPVLLVAFEGLFDIGGVATAALQRLVADRTVRSVAHVDPDRFFDFTVQRPRVWLDEGGERHLAWPANETVAISAPGASRDLLVLAGTEPHLRWRTFARCLIDLAKDTGCETVVTVGGSAERIPHTRTPNVFGSTTNRRLAAALGLSHPRYQGPTGVLGVLHTELDRSGVPAISLRVPVPHYLVNAQHPQSVAALLRHLEHVLGVPTGHGELDDEIGQWRQLHDSAVDADPAAAAYVRSLEHDYDMLQEVNLPSADDLAAEFEAFLRDREDGDDAAGGEGGEGGDPG